MQALEEEGGRSASAPRCVQVARTGAAGVSPQRRGKGPKGVAPGRFGFSGGPADPWAAAGLVLPEGQGTFAWHRLPA